MGFSRAEIIALVHDLSAAPDDVDVSLRSSRHEPRSFRAANPAADETQHAPGGASASGSPQEAALMAREKSRRPHKHPKLQPGDPPKPKRKKFKIVKKKGNSGHIHRP